MARPKLTEEHRHLLQMLGASIRERREESGASLEAVATALGADRQYVSEVEAGRVNIHATRVIEFARALGVAPASLLNGLEDA